MRITEKVFARSLTLLNDLKDSQDKIDDYSRLPIIIMGEYDFKVYRLPFPILLHQYSNILNCIFSSSFVCMNTTTATWTIGPCSYAPFSCQDSQVMTCISTKVDPFVRRNPCKEILVSCKMAS